MTQPAKAPTAPTTDSGFTLLELLVVIAILGLLVAIAGPSLINVLGGAKVKVVHLNLNQLDALLDQYKLDTDSYPTTEQGLAALSTKPSDVVNWNGPYMKNGQLNKDPWNHDWIYRSPSNRTGHDYDLCSAGSDGKGTGPGEGDAICNP